MKFSNWNDDQPNNWQGNQHCAFMHPDKNEESAGKWGDTDCANEYEYICETKMIPKPGPTTTTVTPPTTVTPTTKPSDPMKPKCRSGWELGTNNQGL